MMKHLLNITDLSKDDLLEIFELSSVLYEQSNALGQNTEYFKNKTMAMIFEKPSLRTRLAFEIACNQLGGNAIALSKGEILVDALGNPREPLSDIALNLSNYVDVIFARVCEHVTVNDLAEHSKIPVINGLSDLHHPTQAIADLFTLWMLFDGDLSGLKVVFVGDPCNVATSLLLGCEILGIDFTISFPEKYCVPDEILQLSKGAFKVLHEPFEAVKNTDVIYTDTWVSMGLEQEKVQRLKDFSPYQINVELVQAAKEDVKIMHCLPAHWGEEITAEVLNGPNSIVLKQSYSKLLTAKAIIKFLIQKS